MADIFVSYTKADVRLTQELVRYLEDEGYTCWWDARLLPSERFPTVIKRELDAAKAVIVIWSERSIKSEWVRAEAEIARHQQKLILLCDHSLDPDQIPTPFNILITPFVTERARVLEALAQLGIVALSKKARIAKAIVECDREDFRELIELSRLDPSRHLRFWDWSGLNFEGTDLHGYDFTGALLRNCQFQGARIAGARFDKADLSGSNLRAAADWPGYVTAWRSDPNAPTDEHLTAGAVFQDAPFAPEMVKLPPGRFWMGSRDGEGEDSERPRHEVTIPHAIAVGRFPVTFEEWDFAQADAEWRGITGRKSRKAKDEGWGRDRRPVIDVSWEDAQAYARWLSGKTGQPYRLLSEAEWEYACRAGSEAAYCFGDNEAELGDYAWFDGNSGGRTHPVGGKKPNGFRLYDMHGNVLEWCEDILKDSYWDKPGDLKANGGAWTTGRGMPVLRGGSWYISPHVLRSAGRSGYYGADRSDNFGFRLARTLSF